jgi:hypothetical protein
MAYSNNLLSFTKETTPGSPYAFPPSVICNFGWYNSSGAIFGTLSYSVAGNTYPPVNAQGQYSNPKDIDYITNIGEEVTFNALNSLNIVTTLNGTNYPLDSCIVPPGIQIIDYSWDFGNGQRAHGPVVSTSYTQPTPDGACTLTITDSLGRVTSTTRRLNFVDRVAVSATSQVTA